MTNLKSRYQSMPRATKWLLWTCVGVMAFFFAVDPILASFANISSSADAKSAMLATYAKNEKALQRADETVRLGVRQFGEVQMPIESELRPLEFNRTVDEVLRTRDVRELTSTTRTAPLRPGPLTGKVPMDFRVDKLMKDIGFVAKPADLAAIIADLERSTLVSTISQLQVRQVESRDSPDQLVRVKLVVECWVLARKGKK